MTSTADPTTPASPRRSWLLIREVLIAIALVANLLVVHDLISKAQREVVVTASAGVGGVFGLGAMRRPRFFLTVLVVAMVALPQVSDSSDHELFRGCLLGSCLLGAVTGWAIRRVDRRRSRRAARALSDSSASGA